MDRIQKLTQMLEASPRDCFLLHALGLEYIKLGELNNALNYFEKVIASDKNYVGTYYHLAKVYEKIGEEANAIETYENGIQVAILLKDQHAKNELQMALEDLTM